MLLRRLPYLSVTVSEFSFSSKTKRNWLASGETPRTPHPIKMSITHHPSKTLILFIHGFLGSESSFCSFPLDLVQSVRKLYNLKQIEAKVFPFFATKGDPEKAINSLYNWLLLNASQPEYDSVIILAHSMGGLIATDAFRKLLALRRKNSRACTAALAGVEKNAEEEEEERALVKSKHLSIASADVDLRDFTLHEASKAATTDEKDATTSTISPSTTTPTTDLPSNPESIQLQEKADQKPEASSSSWFSSSYWWPGSTNTTPSSNNSAARVGDPIVSDGESLESFPVEAVDPQQQQDDDSQELNQEKVRLQTTQRPNLTTTDVNIISIICFDSPFYGLSTSVFTKGVGDYSADIISSYVPAQHADTVNSTLKYGNDLAVSAVSSIPKLLFSDPRKAASIIVRPIRATPAMLSSAAGTVSSAAGTVSLAVSSVISSSFVALAEKLDVSGSSDDLDKKGTTGAGSGAGSAAASSISIATPASTAKAGNTAPESASFNADSDDNAVEQDTTTRPELLPIPRDTDWSSWITLGLTTAALGVGYYSGGLLAVGAVSQLARGAALAYAVPAAESGRQHLQFLYPIWGESQKASEARVKVLAEQHALGSFFARVYYIDIDMAKRSQTTTPTQRTFIKPPPSSPATPANLGDVLDTRHLFHRVGSDLDNEIGAHMKMFSREECPGSYWDLVHKAGRDIKYILSRHRDVGFTL